MWLCLKIFTPSILIHFCLCRGLFVHAINFLSHSLSGNMRFICLVILFSNICTRLKARANIENKMTRQINLILHSRSYDNHYVRNLKDLIQLIDRSDDCVDTSLIFDLSASFSDFKKSAFNFVALRLS